MNLYLKTKFIFLFSILAVSINAQIKKELTIVDKEALENIIIEKYYISTDKDAADTIGGTFPKGAITYRIYVDLKPEYKLQAVYGVPKHNLFIKTTSTFFNNKTNGMPTGGEISDKLINENTTALDSWIAMGAATKHHFGILKADDKDGSIITRDALKNADGLIKGFVYQVAYFGLDPSFFNNTKDAAEFHTNNGSWAILGGIKGPTDDNRILIAQLTTNGTLSFELNIQVGTPSGGVVQYVAKNPEGNEIKFDALTFPLNQSKSKKP